MIVVVIKFCTSKVAIKQGKMIQISKYSYDICNIWLYFSRISIYNYILDYIANSIAASFYSPILFPPYPRLEEQTSSTTIWRKLRNLGSNCGILYIQCVHGMYDHMWWAYMEKPPMALGTNSTYGPIYDCG